jgi:hypothetical protein
MKDYQLYARMIGVAFVVLVGTSASEAGLFRNRHMMCYEHAVVSTDSAAMTPVPSPAPTHAAAPAPSGAVIIQTANKPAIRAEPTAPAAATNCAPSTTSGGESSAMPQNSWDFGRFPPYR